MAEVGRKARHGVSKEKTGASVPEGYREWLLRYSERAYSIHEGASRAIYEFVRYDIGGARWLMNQVIQEGLHVPDSVKELIDIYPGEPETRRILREMKAPYDAVKTTGAKADDENYVSPSGPPTYFAEKMTRIGCRRGVYVHAVAGYAWSSRNCSRWTTRRGAL